LSNSEKMRVCLKERVLPYLRSKGFKGVLPHLRRIDADGIDLITFQFDKYGRPSFCVEYAFTAPFTPYELGPKFVVSEKNVKTSNFGLKNRLRLNPANAESKVPFDDYWFDFEQTSCSECAEKVIQALPIAEKWFLLNRDDQFHASKGTTKFVLRPPVYWFPTPRVWPRSQDVD